MQTFEHIEYCMGTAFKFAGRTQFDSVLTDSIVQQACAILHEADNTFSLYKPESPVSKLARGETTLAKCPPVVGEIWDECDRWESITDGWFSAMTPQNTFDPSGVVKTWAAKRAAEHMVAQGIFDFTMNAGGDVWLADNLASDVDWRIGISKPVSIASPDAGVLATIDLKGTEFRAMATSGSAERGLHIWNPKAPGKSAADELLQVSVVADDLVRADVFATAAFAEGARAVSRLDALPNIEALFVLADGQLAATRGFSLLFAR